MTVAQFKNISHLLSKPTDIVVIPHKNADGDAIGSALAMFHYLTLKKHRVKVVSPNDYPEFLKWLPGTDNVLRFDLQNSQSKRAIDKATIIFLLDFNDLNRVGDDMEKTLQKFEGDFIMIDHHEQPSDVAKYLFSDTAICATAQMVYHFLENTNDVSMINKDIATCLYTGILTDTGSFRFPKTTPTTFRIVASLIEKGADNARIYNNIYDTNSYGRLQLLGQALQNLKVLEEYSCAYITLTDSEKKAHNFQKGDTEGVVNYALSIKGISFGVIFIEDIEQGIIKISFRSKGRFSVNQFARKHFEGGGHDNAAGGKSYLSMEETVEKFVKLLPEYKESLNLSDEI